jgi:hypothetical protein
MTVFMLLEAGAAINRLSVGHMTSADSKIGCWFEDGKFMISCKNKDGRHSDIYEGLQVNHLFFLDIEFILSPMRT